MADPISNTQDIIDSRDILERIKELESLEDEIEEEDKEELTKLKALIEELRDSGGDSPEDGITLIHEDYFEDYAQELAEDIGAIGKDNQWPLHCIDWDRAANELKVDYSEVEFDGQTYYYR